MSTLRRHPFLTLGGIVVLALVALVAFRLVSSGAKDEVRKERALTVGTRLPIRRDLEVRLSYTAEIQPHQQLHVFSRVDGYIAKIHVERGDFVKAKQVLVEIDHTDYEHQLNMARANLEAARADVIRQEATIRNAKLNLERMRSLIQEEFVSRQDLDDAQATYDAAVAQIDALRARVKQMAVALQQAETNLTYTYIRAPFAGYVAARNLDPGAYVSGSTASTSTISRGILLLHDTRTVRVLLEVVEKDVPLVKIGQRAEARVDAYPERTWTGTLSRVVHAVDRSTRTMTVEMDLPNPDRLLKGGMFARVDLFVGRRPQALQIPIDAVTRLETEQYVYIVQEGRARKVPVTLGIQRDHWVEITAGLSGTEPVIVSGKDLVTDGAAVTARPLDAAPVPATAPAT